MNFLVFVLEILIVMPGIVLVPARSALRVRRARVIHNGETDGSGHE